MITHSVRSMYVVYMCMYVVFCKIDHCIHIHWCIVMGLGPNDPWVESHMWPQQTWGQRSSRGQWPLVQIFAKKGQCIHILWCIFKSNILQWMQKNVIAKAGETRGSRTALSLRLIGSSMFGATFNLVTRPGYLVPTTGIFTVLTSWLHFLVTWFRLPEFLKHWMMVVFKLII